VNDVPAFGKCLLLSITDALEGALAGRPMSFRITSRPRAKLKLADHARA
jgi:hypothetical protein